MTKQTGKIPVIHDGDHGSDDFVTTMIFAGRPDVFNLLGVTTGFGNTSAANATRNALAALALAGRSDIPVHQGSERPFMAALKGGDNAFDENGLGGVEFPCGTASAGQMEAVAWMADTLRASPEPVTLCLTGLMTNTARLLAEHPDVRGKIKRIVAMGGCLGPLGPNRTSGNITPFAEFNFHMDPEAAAAVLNSDIPTVLLPMDATHQTIFTPEYQALLAKRLPSLAGGKLTAMMRAAEKYDIPKFGLTGAVLHDQNVALYLMMPHLYEGRKTSLRIETDDPASPRHGQMHIDGEDGPVLLIENITDPDAVFDAMCHTLENAFRDKTPRPAPISRPGPA